MASSLSSIRHSWGSSVIRDQHITTLEAPVRSAVSSDVKSYVDSSMDNIQGAVNAVEAILHASSLVEDTPSEEWFSEEAKDQCFDEGAIWADYGVLSRYDVQLLCYSI